MNDIINYTLRAILKVGGGILISKGLTDDVGLEQAVGALVVLIGFVWGIFKKSKGDKPIDIPIKNQVQLFLFLFSLFFLVGCKTTPSPERIAYDTLNTISISTDAAMKAWGNYVRDNKISIEDPTRIKVRNAYVKYQSAMALAQEVVISIKTNQKQDNFSIALDVVADCSQTLINIIIQNIPPKK